MKRGEVATQSFDVIPRIAPRAIEAIYRDIGGGKGLAWLKEAVDNSADAKADEIRITIRNLDVEIADNGNGFRRQDIEGYVSIGLSTPDLRKKGKNGTGAKAVFAVADHVFVRSVCAENPGDVLEFSFTEEVVQRLAERREPVHVRVEPRTTTNFPPRLASGSVITYTGFQAHKIPRVDTAVDKLGQLLSPWRADLVRVNGKSLTPRNIRGEQIERDIKHPTLGQIRVRLYVPDKRERTESLQIGAFGDVCTMDDFRRNLGRDLLNRVPAVFDDNRLCGLIDVEGFNPYTTNDRTNFRTELYESDDVETFLDVLDDLSEEISERIGLIVKAATDQAFDEAFDALQEELNARYHYHPTGDAPGKGGPGRARRFSISMREVELAFNERQIFRVRHYSGDPADLVWEASEAGGTLDAGRGVEEVTYTAGQKQGRFVLRVSSAIDPNLSASSVIHIVQQREFFTVPSRITVIPGEEVKIYARNLHLTSGDLRWCPEKSGGMLNTSRGSVVVYTAGEAEGEFALEVEDRKLHTLQYTLPIRIVGEKRERPQTSRSGRSSRREIKVRNRVFSISYWDWDGPETFRCVEGSESNAFQVNTGHTLYTSIRGRGPLLRQELLKELFLAYAMLEAKGEVDTLIQLRAELLAEHYA